MKKLVLFSGLISLNLAVFSQSEWTVCLPPITVDYTAVYMPQPNKVLIGGTGGTLLMSEDLGSTFQTIFLENNLDIAFIQFTDPMHGFLIQESDLLTTSDGGFTWEYVSTVPGNVRNIQFVSSTLGFVASDNGEAYRTTDGGLTWDLLNTGTGERLLAVSFRNASEGFFGGKKSVSAYTDDQGQTFIPGGIPANGDIMDMQFVNASQVYSCGEEGEVLHSGDGGNTWTSQLTPDGNVDLNALHFAGLSDGWTVGTAGAIFHTDNGGASWVSDISNSTRDLQGVHFYDATQGIAVGTNGTILRLGDIATTVDENSAARVAIHVFPNPVTEKGTFISPDYSMDSEFFILDLSGKTIYQAVVNSREMQFNVIDLGLNPGLYFLMIASAEGKQTTKFIVK